MGFFHWGKGSPSSTPSNHELAHERAGRGERLPNPRWWDDNGNARIQHDVPLGKNGSRRAAVVQAAGYLSSSDGGFEDKAADRAYAKILAKEAGVSLAEIEAEARRKGYVR